VVSTRARLNAEHAGVEGSLQHVNEQHVGDDDNADAIGCRGQNAPTLDDNQQSEDQQNISDQEPKPVEQQDRRSGDADH